MKNLKSFAIVSVFAVLMVVVQACNFSTANMSSLTTSKDKEGKQTASSFSAGDTLYARAAISNNPGKVKVKFYLVADDVKGMTKGETLKGSNVSADVDGDGAGLYNVPVSAGFLPGTYTLNADMINDSGEKKDSKNAKVTVTGGSGSSGDTSAPPTMPNENTSSESNN